MPAPQTNFNQMVDDAVSLTMRNYQKKLVSNIGNNNALVNKLLKRKNFKKKVDGGTDLVIPLSYAENKTYQPYDGYDLLNITPQQVFSVAKYDWKQIAISICISGKEKRTNSGKYAIKDLITSRVQNAMETFENQFEADMHGNGTLYAGKQITGLAALLPKVPTSGVVGGIDRANNPFWQSKAQDASVFLGGSDATKDTIKRVMNNFWLKMVYGANVPDLILADDLFYTMYEEALQDIQRITTDKEANAGYSSLRYKSAEFALGGGGGSVMPTKTMYYLNTKYINYYHLTDDLLDVISENSSINQDATVKILGHMGNFGISRSNVMGQLFE